jgi:prevent-host-death family protein
MKSMNITEVPPQLNEIIKITEKGESVLITINGTPKFRAIPANRKRIGLLAGMPPVPDDIKTPFAEEIEEMFYGKNDQDQ